MPPGLMARNPPPTVLTTVTLHVIAVAPAGTKSDCVTDPSRMLRLWATDTVRLLPAPSAPGDGDATRESYTRPGLSAWNAPADDPPPSFRHVPGVPEATQTQTSTFWSTWIMPTVAG